MPKTLEICTYGVTTSVVLEISKYANNDNLAIELWCFDEGCWEPYARLTVNLDIKLPADTAFVDTNNLPGAERFIVENDLGTPTGNMRLSGYCMYSEYKFDLEKIKQYCLPRSS